MLLGLASQAGLVTQRLKRYESIVAKLVRARTGLGEMEDIAGCRAVLPSRQLVTNILWCRRDDFTIEIQLRTARQQRWAELVEDLSPLRAAQDGLETWLRGADHG